MTAKSWKNRHRRRRWEKKTRRTTQKKKNLNKEAWNLDGWSWNKNLKRWIFYWTRLVKHFFRVFDFYSCSLTHSPRSPLCMRFSPDVRWNFLNFMKSTKLPKQKPNANKNHMKHKNTWWKLWNWISGKLSTDFH